MDVKPLLPELITLIENVIQAIMPLYLLPDRTPHESKADGSPLTEADQLAHQLIVTTLSQLTPHIPIISEEACSIPFSTRQTWPRYWLIDPIDGTKEFITKTGEFTINIALIEDAQPVFGLIGVPTTQCIYYGFRANGAFKKDTKTLSAIHVQTFNQHHPLRVVASRRHGAMAHEKIQAHLPNVHWQACGSSLKFCLLAEGLADVYPRLGPTSEWDTAAAQCILEAAGGKILDFSGNPLKYNSREDYRNPHFIALADENIPWQTWFSS